MKPTPRQRDILAGRGRRVTIPYDEPELLLLVRLAMKLTPMHVRFVRILCECFIAEQMLEEPGAPDRKPN